MDIRTFSLLGFDRIQNLISTKTQTVFGKELAKTVAPLPCEADIENEFDLIQECINISEEISLYNITDLRQYLTSLNSASVLPANILRDTLITMEAIRHAKEFIAKRKNQCPKLYHISTGLIANQQIEKAIINAVDEYGEIRTNASPKLKKIRSEITRKRNDIIKKIEELVIEKGDYLQDKNFTIRHDRFCLPIKIEDQKKLPGILHEYSPAGKTIFIEPLSLVDNQNELSRYHDEEKNEINRILSYLTSLLFNIKDELLNNFSIVARIDLLYAKRCFALQYRCFRPKFSQDGKIRILQAIHPLLTLTKKDIIPLDLVFPENINIILISGPNAGGKTVVIKTVGLFALMFLSGIFLPAATGTEMPFFEYILADIGDEQSIDSSLSSFSAHILRVKEILEKANSRSLILLDEIGSSTSPEEGSALAITVLERIRDKGACCLATSHFNPLKSFVNDASGMINAAMEYTDRPTYRFSIGLPGTSSALEISKELGFPSELLERAKKFINQDWLHLSDRLKSLANETEKTIVLNEKLNKEKIELDRLKIEYENKYSILKKFEQEERKKILNQSYNELLVQRRNIENLVRNIKESIASKQSISEAKTYINNQINTISEKVILPKQEKNLQDAYHIGDCVYSKTFQKNGLIQEIYKTNLVVAFGSIKLELGYDDITKVINNENSINSDSTPLADYDNKIEFSSSLNIIGNTQDEAYIKINRFLDDAINNNIFEVSIIHGKGKGILKELIWEKFIHDIRVDKLRFGEPFEGGMGLTKITMKKY